MDLFVFLLAFAILMILGSPIYVSMIVSSLVYIFMNPNLDLMVAVQKLSNSVNSFPLLAVPLFVFAGEVMNQGGVTDRLFNFANSLVGRFRGGLAHVNIVNSVIFAGMSGSALADVGGPGQMEMKAMRDHGYDDDIVIGLTAASGTLGPIIPPSIPFVTYGAFAGVSIGGLFMGGFLPGLFVAISLMVMVAIYTKKRGYERGQVCSFKEILRATKSGIPALMSQLILIGGIWNGFFTPTEAAMVSILYSLLLSVFAYKDLSLRDIPKLLISVFKTIAPSLVIVAGATLFGWVLTYEKVDQFLLHALTNLTSNKYVILLIFNLFLFLLGMLMDGTAAMLICIPIMMPVAGAVGIHPLHLGVVVVLNLMIGLMTPPVGFSLNILSSITGYKIGQISKFCLPWLIPLIIALFVITYIPESVLFIPRIMGLLG